MSEITYFCAACRFWPAIGHFETCPDCGATGRAWSVALSWALSRMDAGGRISTDPGAALYARGVTQ